MVGLATPDKTQRVVVVPQHFDDVFPLSGPLCICRCAVKKKIKINRRQSKKPPQPTAARFN